MSKLYKTARGKGIDIDRIKLSNENTVAVGNMGVNARGDLIGAGKKITMGRNQIMDKVYAVPDAPSYSPNDPKNHMERQSILEANNAKQLNDLVHNLTVPITPPTQTESQPVTLSVRGNLANSVAKPTTVEQKALPTPKEQAKSNGPSRI
jgi:hypothetical protein